MLSQDMHKLMLLFSMSRADSAQEESNKDSMPRAKALSASDVDNKKKKKKTWITF